MLMIQIAAAVLLLLGSGLIFKALVEIDAPTARPKSLARRPSSTGPTTDDDAAIPLRRAA